MTDPATEREVLSLFAAMLDVPEADRDDWIAAHSTGKPAIAERLHALREADRHSIVRTGSAADTFDEEAAPERIGAYRITSRIGRGGMGSVYRGERDAGDFAHDVAIKIIKPGLLSSALVERFRRERQTLASLRHPNIAQLYDGGETEGGSPYIIMENVDGLPLLQWVDAHDVDTDTRRRLFHDICSAVAFAHRNLIIHRDLTPSNVLVTTDGTIKLIDFGIARAATFGPLANVSPSVGSLSLTPGYAAPERLTSGLITTATDIYSLGRLLEKLIRPASPDVELQSIITKATAEDPLHRYLSAEALSADVDAWARSFPVSTMTGSRVYLTRKFMARHRAGVAASVIALALLLGAFGATLRAYSVAETARSAETLRFNQLRSLARYMLFDLNDRLSRTVGNTQARINLAERAQNYLATLGASPGISDELRNEAAEGYIKLARIQGVPSEPNFGQHDKAKSSLAAAERLLSGNSSSQRAKLALARLHAYRAVIQAHGDQEMKLADQSIGRATAMLGKSDGPGRDAGWYTTRSVIRKAQIELADLADDMPRLARLAAQLGKEADEWPPPLLQSRVPQIDRAYSAYYSAYADSFGENTIAASLPKFRDAETRFRKLEKELPNDPVILYMLAYTGYNGFAAASTIGRDSDSGYFIGLAQTTIDRLLAIDDQDDALHALSANIREAQSQWLRDQGRFDEAIKAQTAVVAARQAALTAKRPAKVLGNLGFSEAVMGVIARDAGDRNRACRAWGDAERHFSELERREELIGFYAGFLPGLRTNIKKCAAGRPISELGPLK